MVPKTYRLNGTVAHTAVDLAVRDLQPRLDHFEREDAEQREAAGDGARGDLASRKSIWGRGATAG